MIKLATFVAPLLMKNNEEDAHITALRYSRAGSALRTDQHSPLETSSRRVAIRGAALRAAEDLVITLVHTMRCYDVPQ